MKPTFIIVLCTLLFMGCKQQPSQKGTVLSDKSAIEKYTFLLDLEGEAFEINELKGKRVLLNFWATWCGPCRNEMPDLLKAQDILADENYVFLLVSDESIKEIIDFKAATEYDFKFLKSKRSFETLSLYMLPTTYIFDENGVIIEKIKGVRDWDSDKMIEKLKNI